MNKEAFDTLWRRELRELIKTYPEKERQGIKGRLIRKLKHKYLHKAGGYTVIHGRHYHHREHGDKWQGFCVCGYKTGWFAKWDFAKSDLSGHVKGMYWHHAYFYDRETEIAKQAESGHSGVSEMRSSSFVSCSGAVEGSRWC